MQDATKNGGGNMVDNDLLTVTEVARRLVVSSESVRAYERGGKLKAALRTRAGMRLFAESEVERFARAREEVKRRRV